MKIIYYLSNLAIINIKIKYIDLCGNLETIVGAMFAGKTSELLKESLAKHQNKKIIVIKPSIDNRYQMKKL